MWRATEFVKKRLHRKRSVALSNAVIRTLDQAAFDSIYRKYATYFTQTPYTKYLNARYWLLDAAHRFYRYGLHHLPPGRRFLDIGSGAGYFLAVCRQSGHQVLGLDTSAWPIFNDMIAYFGIDRLEHRIEPGRPLPSFGHRFDVVTAFMTGFNKRADGMPWDEHEWVPFLSDLRQHVTDGGTVAIKFNLNKRTGAYYPKSVRSAIQAMPRFEARFRRDKLQLFAI